MTKRPRLLIAAWLLALLLLAAKGSGIDGELGIHPLYVDGSASQRAHEIADREFGGNFTMIVMLRGPREAVGRQGRLLASRLGAIPRVQVVSPWARGATIEGLRPHPDVAALIVRLEVANDDEGLELATPVRQQVQRTVGGPVRASIAGLPAIIDSFRAAIEDSAKVGLLISIPVLLFVLLFVFRSLLAAAMPLLIGGSVVAAARGILSLLAGVMQLDLFALSIVAMMGLALGVDYSLLVVSRFREEYRGGDPTAAARITAKATTRSVLPAGTALILAMVAPLLLLPSSIARSVAASVISVALLSMFSALCLAPALLSVFGDRLDRWSLPGRDAAGAGSLRWARRVSSHPRAVTAIMLLLLFLAGWAFTLKSSLVNPALLPPGDAGRRQQEVVERDLGPGWTAPIEVIVDGKGRPITTQRRLREMASFQQKVEGDPGVKTMAGLAQIERGVSGLQGAEDELLAREQGVVRLKSGITRLAHGAELNTGGLLKAAQGSSALKSGIDAASTGAQAIAGGLQKTSEGSQQLSAGLGQASAGSGKLARGSKKASSGAGKIADALDQVEQKSKEVTATATLFKSAMRDGKDRLGRLYSPVQGTEQQLVAAWQALLRMKAGQTDPEYAAALRAVEEANRRLTGIDLQTGEPSEPPFEGVEAGLEGAESQFDVGLYLASQLDKNGRRASEGMSKLARAAGQLHRGIQRLAAGSNSLTDGVSRLIRGGEVLSPALQQLGKGAELLTGGLGKLQQGAGGLAVGLGTGAEKSKLLSGGLGKVEAGLNRESASGQESGLSELQQRSPGLFRSAYFVLAGLDGSKPRQRTQLGFLVNLDRGGTYARMLVVPSEGAMGPGAAATRDRLAQDSSELARKTDTEVIVGGEAPTQIDANDALRTQTLPMRLFLSLISMLILIPVTRSLAIPFFAALINLVTVSASLGLLSLLFNGSLLGGPGFVDATVIPSTIIIMFGLAIDYEVFVFARIREEYVRTGSTREAIDSGLDRVGHVVSGAAMIMIAVFLASSVTEFMTIRNFGVAQAVAVFIDAFIVRLIVVPAMMIWLGKWCWWLPRWLDRLLPGSSSVGPAAVRGASP